MANSIGAVLNTPIDVVKTRIQKQLRVEAQHNVATDFHMPRYNGTFDCFKRILVDEVHLPTFEDSNSSKALISLTGPYCAVQRCWSKSRSISSFRYWMTILLLLYWLLCSSNIRRLPLRCDTIRSVWTSSRASRSVASISTLRDLEKEKENSYHCSLTQ